MNVPSGYTALGLIGFTDQGVYNSATAYVRNDIVHYNGNLWRCLVDDTTAVTPAEGANWTVYLAEPTSAAEDIIAPVEATATSTRIYAIGDQLILADVLYDVTQAINIGDTLTVGTNIAAADTIVEQIAEKANSADLATVATSGAYSDLSGKPTLGTAAAKNVPASGDASTTEVVMGDDTRLTNARNAADVSAWAKAANKPIYNGSEIKTSTAKTGTAQQSISDTVTSGTSMDNVVGTMLDNDKTLDTNVTSLKETFTNNGAHNLLNSNINFLVTENTSGEWNNNEYTYKGVTFTVNQDGSVTVSTDSSGTTEISTFYLIKNIRGMFDGQEVTISGCPAGSTGSGSSKNYCMYVRDNNDVLHYFGDEGFTGEIATGNATPTGLAIRINTGVILSAPITYYPMLRLASDTDNTYTPYAKTNQQLTKDDIALTENEFVNNVVNMLPNNATTQVFHGVTYTINSDGTIQTSGTASDSSGQFIISRFYLPNGFYKLSGGINSNRPLVLSHAKGNVNAVDYGGGVIFEADSSLQLAVYITTKGDMSGLTYKPMITVADMPNSDYAHYVPYAKSNKELTDLWIANKYVDESISTAGSAFDFTNATKSFKVNKFTRRCIASIDGAVVKTQISKGAAVYIGDLASAEYNPPISVINEVIANDGTNYLRGIVSKASSSRGILVTPFENFPVGATVSVVIEWSY